MLICVRTLSLSVCFSERWIRRVVNRGALSTCSSVDGTRRSERTHSVNWQTHLYESKQSWEHCIPTGPCYRMVQHNEPGHAAAPQGPPKPTEDPPEPSALPTHFHPFRHQQDRCLINQAAKLLANSGFYWGPLDVDEAHARLAELPVGTFLIRDSTQTDIFFTLSYRAADGPTSVRVLLKNGAFSLDGSKHSFPCLFALLEFYIKSPKRSLKTPLRRSAPQTLQELSRRAVVRTYGRESIGGLPVSAGLKDFLNSYPFTI